MSRRWTGMGSGRPQRVLTAVLLVAELIGGARAIEPPIGTAASTTPAAGPWCKGFSACSVAPYTTHNFQNENKRSYWGMPPDQDTAPSGAWANCTNYVAFVESTAYGAQTPKHALPVNAMNWATGARENGYTVDQTPTVGSVAQWYANDNKGVIGPDGHVAVVEAVGPKDSYIVISQDNWSTDADFYGWALVLNNPDTPGAEPWPDNFIHFPTTRLPTTLSYAQPGRLVQSTGNLYWTADQTQGSEWQADVFRASKGNEPGQERALYQESSSAPVDFEAITYANVGGTWYGYFVANYPGQDQSQLMRVPLAGGAAVVLGTSPAVIGNDDLVTDGSFLYWADAGGIRKMAVTGGPVQTLVSGQTFAHLGLDGPVLYYSSGNSVLRVPATGGTSTTVVPAASAITAIFPPTATNLNVCFGEANGSVNLFPGPHGSVYQLQAPSAGVSVTSVSLAGNYVLWGERAPEGYKVDGYDNGNLVSVPASGPPVDVQGDSGAWYWGGSGLEKFTP
ncbi:MAG TPA: CHAP domain-containing protein [Acidimicrobiales bacterium]|nr:CHAP domain-containing protein [Acidimicrobiales bacterium]